MPAGGAVGLAGQAPDVIASMRAAVARQDFGAGDRMVAEYRAALRALSATSVIGGLFRALADRADSRSG